MAGVVHWAVSVIVSKTVVVNIMVSVLVGHCVDVVTWLLTVVRLMAGVVVAEQGQKISWITLT